MPSLEPPPSQDVPVDAPQFRQWLYSLWATIALASNVVTNFVLTLLKSAPNATIGGLYYADGINWNPGQGEGVYQYNSSGVFVFMGMSLNVQQYGAKGDNAVSESTKIQTALSTGKVIYFPQGVYAGTVAMTGQYRYFGAGVQFTGTIPVDSPFPAFGPGVIKCVAAGNSNSIIGISYNMLPANTLSFPTGVTAYARMDNGGNQAFGLFARVDQYSTGTGTNEINSFNFGNAPSASLPPDRSFGTLQTLPICVTVAAGGTQNSAIGIHLTPEGSQPKSFLTGIYSSPDACVNYGAFFDATSTVGPTYQLFVKHAVTSNCIACQSIGAQVDGNAWLTYQNGASVPHFAIRQSGVIAYPAAITATTVGAAGAASVLPSNPTGYLQVQIGGVTKKIPYYE